MSDEIQALQSTVAALERERDELKCLIIPDSDESWENLRDERDSLARQVEALKTHLCYVLAGADYYGSVEIRRGPADDKWVAWRQRLKDARAALAALAEPKEVSK